MPKVINYTPPWLSRPSPGSQLFELSTRAEQCDHDHRQNSESHANGNGRLQEYLGPKRTIAHRGTEIFVVVDNEIRWSDLCLLKENWEELQQRKAEPKPLTDVFFRVLKAPVSEKIRQLLVSPNGQLLAIVTSHTLKVALLPGSSHLGQDNISPLKLKTYTVGSTTHVLSQAPIASVLWHPCGVGGSCLVTVTVDATVRIWEFNVENRWSFDSPTLAVDLRKLSAAESQEDDVSPVRMNENRGFSAYAIDMEIASACFGGTGSSTETPWSAMTLWVATTEGDVYALCPLIPSKWQPSSTQLPCLSATAVLQSKSVSPDEPVSQEDMHLRNDQYEWLSNLDSQNPLLLGESGFSPSSEVYSRPQSPGPIPRLQGPFEILAGSEDQELEISDIHVIAASIDAEDLMRGEDDQSDLELLEETGLSATVVCLLTSSGMMYVCLDLDGVEAQWLPRKGLKSQRSYLPTQQLVVLETLNTLPIAAVDEEEWPTFSLDPASRYSFFLTHHAGVYFFSLEPWLERFEKELQSLSTAGAEFRLDLFINGCNTLREKIIGFGSAQSLEMGASADSCIVLQDSDLGYFLLTTYNGQPKAAILDSPKLANTESYLDSGEESPLLTIGPVRSAYEPSPIFWAESELPSFAKKNIPSRNGKREQEIRLSPATLDAMTGAHRLLSQETHTLGIAVADLFRRCERLLDDLSDQVKRANEVANRTEQIVGVNGDPYSTDADSESGDRQRAGNEEALQRRIEAAVQKQDRLMARHQQLSKKFRKIGGPGLSDAERGYTGEVEKLAASVLEPEEHERQSGEEYSREGSPRLRPWQRYQEVRQLVEELVKRAKEAQEDAREKGERQEGEEDEEEGGFSIPGELRRKKVLQVMALLDREEALVDAARGRLERLTIGDDD